jgi:cytochrome c peroxidase
LDDLPGLAAKVAQLHALDGGTQLNDLVASDRRVAELGRFVATLDPADIGKFRTPSLRNVARTAPYMHDGNVESLAEAVDLELYSRGAAGAKPIVLTAQERADVIEFLQALSSGS